MLVAIEIRANFGMVCLNRMCNLVMIIGRQHLGKHSGVAQADDWEENQLSEQSNIILIIYR